MAIQPTLALIPAAQGSKFYSVLPTNGVGDFDFTRASTATRINSKGLIEEVASGVSRLDYTGGGCPHHLLEPQSTNLLTYSEAFDNAYWTKSGSSVTSGFISPTGALGAFKLVEGTSNGIHRVGKASFTANVERTLSVFAKKGERNFISLFENNFPTGIIGVIFNLNNGTHYNTYPSYYSNVKIELISNGWYKCSVTMRNGGLQVPSFGVSSDGLTNSYQGNGTSGVYIYGAQLEQGSYASSYIPTNGSTVTRLAESATGSGNAATFNDSEGVLFAEISALADDETFRYITLSDGTTSNRIIIRYRSSSNLIGGSVIVGGSTVASLSYTSSDITLNSKISIKWKVNDFALWVDGIERDTDTNGAIFTNNTLNSLKLTNALGTGSFFYGKVKNLTVYNTALTALEIETLTSFTSFNEMALNFNYTI